MPLKKKKIYLLFFSLILATAAGFSIWCLIIANPTGTGPTPVFAGDIEILPQKGDVFGVEPETSFMFKTKLAISLEDIQDKLKITPETSFEIKSNGDSKEFEILPKDILEVGKVYQLTFPLEDKNLSWAFEVKPAFKVISTTPRNESTYVPLNAGIEITFNRQGFSNPQQFFEISPNVAGSFRENGETLIFVPAEKLQKGTVYQVKIKKGLPLRDSKDVLLEDFAFAFETEKEEMNAYFSFSSDFIEILPEKEPALKVYFDKIEIEKQSFNLYQFSTMEEFLESYKNAHQNKFYWTMFQTANYTPDQGKKILTFQPKTIEEDKSIIILPQALKEGFYLLETEVNSEKELCWIQSSLISNYFAKTSQNSLAWIFDVSQKTPLTDAKISFFNQEDEFFTDKNGFVEFQTPEYLKSNDINFLIIQKDGYQNKVSVISEGRRHWYWGEGWYSEENEDLYFDYLNTDRSLYRTEDTVHFWGAVKGRNEDLIQKKLLVKFSSSSSQEPLFQKEVIVSSYGTISGDFPFKNLPPGYYYLDLYYGDSPISHSYFQIGIFSKPLYQIKVNAEKEDTFLGEETRFKVKAEFFDGTPLISEKLKYKTYFKNKDYQGEIELDQNGEAEIVIKPEYTGSTASTYWPDNLNLRIWPSLFEEGEIEGRASVNVFGPKMTIRTFNEYDKNKVKITAKLNEINLGEKENGYIGSPVLDYPLNLEIKEITYKKIKTGQIYDYIEKVFYDTFRYDREEKVIENLSQKTNKSGEWILERELDPEKDYLFTFSGKDKDGNDFIAKDYINISIYNYTSDWKTRGIHLKTSKENEASYKIEEKIPLIAERSDGKDFSEKENFLFFGFQNKIEKTILSAVPQTDFVFEEKYIPNIQFRAVWFSSRGFVESNSLNLPFDISQRELKIKISPDKEKYRPGDNVNLHVEARKDNLLKTAEAKVAIIDEALLAIAPDYYYYQSDIYRFYNNVYASPLTIFSEYVSLEEAPNSGAEGGCFLEGTKILVKEGNEKNIEEIKPGDVILTKESESSSNLVPAVVQHNSSHFVKNYLVINGNLKVTPEHKIYLNGKWQEAIKAKRGDFVLDKSGKNIEIETVETKKEQAQVYNIIVGAYHTYFANGIFVHNEEKGAETRENFPDMAFYQTLELKNGIGKANFKLPDNLTSWRIIVEAISKDSDIGKETKNINVSLPFFVNLTLNENYLLEDKAEVIAKAFGEKYTKEGPVSFTLSLPELNYKETIQSQDGKAIFNLPQPSEEGEYEIKLEGKWQSFSDAILRKIKFQKTPLQKTELKTYPLSENLSQIEGNSEGITHIVFLDKIKGRVYPILRGSLWSFGERVEKKISPFFASQILKEYFEEENNIEEKDLSLYRVNNGISLLPWGDADVLTSAMIANLSPEKFLEYGSASYFNQILNDGSRTNRDKSVAFWGLASLSEPVLNKINTFERYNTLGIEEKIYLSLARASIGDYETARKTYYEEIRPNISFRSDMAAYLKMGNEDIKIKLTGLLANLCVVTNEKDHLSLSEYLFQTTPKRDLKTLESLIYIKNFLKNYPSDYNASFDYKIGEKEGSADLNKKIFRLDLMPNEISNLKFSNVKGDIELQSWFLKPITKDELKKSSEISISKTFLLDEKETTQFKEGDLVLIRLNPNFSAEAPNGYYTVTDWLPAGFKPVVQSFREEMWGKSTTCHQIWQPFLFEGSKVSFSWSKEFDKSQYCADRDMGYYARVITPGTYKSSPAILQSSQVPEVITASDEYTIEIK